MLASRRVPEACRLLCRLPTALKSSHWCLKPTSPPQVRVISSNGEVYRGAASLPYPPQCQHNFPGKVEAPENLLDYCGTNEGSISGPLPLKRNSPLLVPTMHCNAPIWNTLFCTISLFLINTSFPSSKDLREAYKGFILFYPHNSPPK